MADATSLAKAASSATPWGLIGQGALGLGQFIAGAVQRKRAEKAAQEQIGKLGPDTGILGYYNQALQRYSGLRAGEGMLQKQYERQAQRNLASSLRTIREAGGAGGVLAGGAAALRAANEGAMRAAATGEQMSGQALGTLGAASQLAAAEKRRPEELRLQMQLQKAAGGSQIANVGLSNIFGAIQSGATQKLYRDLYGNAPATASEPEYPEGYTQGTVGKGMLNLFPTQRTALGKMQAGSIPTPRRYGSLRNIAPYLPKQKAYPFPTYPY